VFADEVELPLESEFVSTKFVCDRLVFVYIDDEHKKNFDRGKVV